MSAIFSAITLFGGSANALSVRKTEISPVNSEAIRKPVAEVVKTFGIQRAAPKSLTNSATNYQGFYFAGGW